MTTIYLDDGLLEELKSILEGEFPVLVNTYIQDSVVRVHDMQAAIAGGDAMALRKAAHSLKGASANLGLLVLTQQCSDMEEAARMGVVTQLDGAMSRLVAEQERAIELLKSKL